MAETDRRLMQQCPGILKHQYQLRFSESGKYRDRVWKILCSDFFSQYIPGNSKVLDLGSGWGEFINNIVATEKYAMDLNPEIDVRLSSEIHCLNQDCSEKWPILSDYLDVVFTSNFLEHLYDKASIERTISEAYRALKNGGLFICMSPNIKLVPGAYWDFWDHHIPLTDVSICEALRMKGFHIKQSIPRFLPYSMSTGSQPPLFLVKLYLRL